MLYFNSDYTEGAHPKILEQLQETNFRQTVGYGEDEYCERARGLIREACGAPEAGVHFLVGGTQANFTVIRAALRPHQGVISPVTGHIHVHETGAVEATGHKVLALPCGAEGKLSAGHARAILAVPSGEAQMKLAKKVVADGLSVRQTESLAKRLAEGAKEAPAPKGDDLSIYDRAAEKDLGARLGRKVHIVRGRRKGRIELEYYDPEDLNALLDLLGQMPGRGKGAQGL